MAALEASLSLSSLYSSSSRTRLASFFAKTHLPNSIITTSPILLRRNHSLIALLRSPTNLRSSLQDIALEEEKAEVEEPEEVESEDAKTNFHRKKLYVVNLPWSLTVVDIKSLFGECGIVVDVEIIKQDNGKSRGFAFVTMETGEQAQAVLDNFNLKEVSGRVIRVEFAKRFKRPPPPPPPGPLPGETRHLLYVGNLEWKVRSTHLKDFFVTQNFIPISAKIVFGGPERRSSGYGFISFATREEAEAAVASLNGKELMGRSLSVKFSEKISKKKSGNRKEKEKIAIEEKIDNKIEVAMDNKIEVDMDSKIEVEMDNKIEDKIVEQW